MHRPRFRRPEEEDQFVDAEEPEPDAEQQDDIVVVQEAVAQVLPAAFLPGTSSGSAGPAVFPAPSLPSEGRIAVLSANYFGTTLRSSV